MYTCQRLNSLQFSIFLLHFCSIFSSTDLLGIKTYITIEVFLFFYIHTDLQHWLLCVNGQSFRGTSRRYNFDQSLSMVWRYGRRCGDAVVCAGKLVTVHQSDDVCWTTDQLRDSDRDENVLQVQIRTSGEYGVILYANVYATHSPASYEKYDNVFFLCYECTRRFIFTNL